MTILLEVLKELWSMFVADARLAVSVLALVLLTAVLAKISGGAPLIAGALLITGCPVILAAAAYREARKRKGPSRSA